MNIQPGDLILVCPRFKGVLGFYRQNGKRTILEDEVITFLGSKEVGERLEYRFLCRGQVCFAMSDPEKTPLSYFFQRMDDV